MKPEVYFPAEFARLRVAFEQGDYSAFLEALHLCTWNKLPLSDWVAAVVIQQAEAAYSEAATGPGRHGNWRKKYLAKQIDEHRAGLAELHLNARRRRGRTFVSELGRVYGYGCNEPPGNNVNIVTRDQIFEFVSQQLRGTPSQGTARAVEDSYKKVRKARRGTEQRRI